MQYCSKEAESVSQIDTSLRLKPSYSSVRLVEKVKLGFADVITARLCKYHMGNNRYDIKS